MRTLLAFPAVLALCVFPACTDDTVDSDAPADIADADGNDLGTGHAVDTQADIAVDDDPTAAGKLGAIMMTLDEGELVLSDFILDVATDPVILDFAEEMVFVHENHMADTAQLLFDLGLAPIESDTSLELAAEVDRNRRLLQTTFDVEFEYMRQQVMMHSESLVIVTVMADIAPYEELQVLFDNTIPVIDEHRAHAIEILRSL
jgi:hypothetical protein